MEWGAGQFEEAQMRYIEYAKSQISKLFPRTTVQMPLCFRTNCDLMNLQRYVTVLFVALI